MTQISGLFLSKWLINLMGWDFFELTDAIFVELHFVTSSVFSIINGSNLLLVSKRISIDPLCLLLLLLEEWALCQLELFMLKSFFYLVLSMMGVFVVLLSLFFDKFSIILSWVRMFSLKVVFSFLSFFISFSSDLIFIFSKFFSSEKLVTGVTNFTMSFT